MILFAYLIVLFALFGLGAFFLTNRGIRGPWERQGPLSVAQQVRRRNRLVLIVVLVLVAISAVMEWFIYEYHQAVLDAQYAIGDRLGSDAILFVESANGGLSWGFYLTILVAVALGLLVGTGVAASRFALMRGTRWAAYL